MNLRTKRIAIVTHVSKTGSANELLTFLLDDETHSVLFIGHPLEYVKDRPGSKLRVFERSKCIRDVTMPNWRLPGIIQYVWDTGLTLCWVLTTRGKWDVIICADNLNTAAGLILRWLGKVRTVVYYTIDFTPQRFENQMLNEIYHRLDAFCLERADLTWNVSERIAEGRETVRGLRRSKFRTQITVPIGIWFDRQVRREFDGIERHTIFYSGALLPHQGLQLVIDAMPMIVRQVPDAVLKIAGLGPFEKDLKAQTVALGLEKHVEFLGYIADPKGLEMAAANSAVAVAMYNEELSRWSYYADPSKIKLYLGAGLPIITTSVTHMAAELERRRCGVVVPYEPAALAEAAIRLLLDDEMNREFGKNAAGYATEFDWHVIFSKALGDQRLGL